MKDGIKPTENAPGQGAPAGTGNQRQSQDPSSNASSNLAQDKSKGTHTVDNELDYYRDFLDDMVTVMRDGDAETVAHLVNLIRSGVPKVQIHHAIQQLKRAGDNAPASRA